MKIFTVRNALKVAFVAALVALMSTTAWGQQNRQERIESRYERQIERQEQREIRREDRRVRRPVSSVPEPTAALLFAGGGLIVAQAIRTNRRKRQ